MLDMYVWLSLMSNLMIWIGPDTVSQCMYVCMKVMQNSGRYVCMYEGVAEQWKIGMYV